MSSNYVLFCGNLKISIFHADEAPVESPLPEDTAVIMYTSGSTGVPKGQWASKLNFCMYCQTSHQIIFIR